jgi:hypothetical protein
MEASVPARLSASEGRRFGTTVGGAFLVLAAVLLWRGRESAAMVAAILGLGLVLGGLLVPERLGPVHRAWMRLALAISKVTTPVLMAVIYFGVVTPIGLARRVAGRRSLPRSRQAESYWVGRERPGRSDMMRQF